MPGMVTHIKAPEQQVKSKGTLVLILFSSFFFFSHPKSAMIMCCGVCDAGGLKLAQVEMVLSGLTGIN